MNQFQCLRDISPDSVTTRNSPSGGIYVSLSESPSRGVVQTPSDACYAALRSTEKKNAQSTSDTLRDLFSPFWNRLISRRDSILSIPFFGQFQLRFRDLLLFHNQLRLFCCDFTTSTEKHLLTEFFHVTVANFLLFIHHQPRHPQMQFFTVLRGHDSSAPYPFRNFTGQSGESNRVSTLF